VARAWTADRVELAGMLRTFLVEGAARTEWRVCLLVPLVDFQCPSVTYCLYGNSTTERDSALVIVRHPLSRQLRGVVVLALLLASCSAPVSLHPFLDGRDIKQDTPGNFHGTLIPKAMHVCRQPVFH
jgi:hypothetical protein